MTPVSHTSTSRGSSPFQETSQQDVNQIVGVEAKSIVASKLDSEWSPKQIALLGREIIALVEGEVSIPGSTYRKVIDFFINALSCPDEKGLLNAVATNKFSYKEVMPDLTSMDLAFKLTKEEILHIARVHLSRENNIHLEFDCRDYEPLRLGIKVLTLIRQVNGSDLSLASFLDKLNPSHLC
ncbi:hypothetical protein [Endozoicomonas sp. SCSIO W0465]|uniref:hypothetical protein n=1 Tax=Endozoicomonas sp. SCSIO W0465 TaxID=2918516 RepID=UPI002076643D|nr:hypothetical protein [Endozoicomonas sp. SCSIO W0465]USE39324.1 hypothetical protein MJO57_14865 [Endozoicomonas sp. SCSIO W0465]